MKELLILGAGTGGAVASNMLSSKLDMKEWRITVIDRAATHIYQPGLLFIPFRFYGYESGEDICRNIESPLPRNVRFVTADIKLVDTATKTVETDSGNYRYDWLISTLGCHIAPEEIEGMAEFMGHGVHTFYDMPGAIRLQRALDEMREGRLVIDIAEMPIKCPVAPLEFAFLADYYFQQKGIRDQIDITLVTPFSGAFTKPNANRILRDSHWNTICFVQFRRILVRNYSMTQVSAMGRDTAILTLERSRVGRQTAFISWATTQTLARRKPALSRISRQRLWSRMCCVKLMASRHCRVLTGTRTASLSPGTKKRCS